MSCMPLTALEGCFLKAFLGGIVSVVGRDGNNEIYQIAWAIVEVENEQCWTWFLKCLIEDLNIADGAGWTFISDQQKGLTNAVSTLAPLAEHRNCARHVYMNWKKTHKEHDLKKVYWKAVKSTYVEKFKSAIQEIKLESRDAYEDFISRDTKKFCKAFISTSACSDVITSNIAESFNASIVEARGKHIIHMFEEIRCTLMTQQVSRLHTISKVHGRICPNIMEKIEKLKFDSREYTAHPALGGKFEVHFEDDKFVVNLGDRTCTCRVWDLTGIPCVHGVACIRFKNEDATTFVDDYYTVSRYLEGYRVGLEPIRGQRMWPEVEETIVKPPVIRRMPGRPKKKRRRAPEEKDPKCPQKKKENWSADDLPKLSPTRAQQQELQERFS